MMTNFLKDEKNNLETFKRYYDNIQTIYRILRYTYNREACLLSKDNTDVKYKVMRHKKVENVTNFRLNVYDCIVYYKTCFNLYYSLARYKNGIPIFHPKLYGSFEGMKEAKIKWKEEHHQHIESFDWLIDIDSPDYAHIDVAYNDALEISKALQEKKILHDIRFSGCGFHIVVEYENIPHKEEYHFNPYKDGNIYAYLGKKTKYYHDRYSALVDYNLNDSRRITKTPYSLVYNHSKSKKIYLCRSLLKGEIFRLKNFEVKNE